MSTNILFAQATDDNEIKITQTGDTLKLYIDQVGFGNKIGGDNASSGNLGSAMAITGSSLEFDLDFLGNGFKIRTNSTYVNNGSNTFFFMAFAEQIGTTPFETEANAE